MRSPTNYGTNVPRTDRRGFTLIELLVVISIVALLIGILLPAIGKARDSAKVAKSMSNLKQFGSAHNVYSSEWNGRQWTCVPDDLSIILSFGGYPSQFSTGGNQANIPSVPLGFDQNGNYYETRWSLYLLPMWYPGNCSQGVFRYFQSRPLNQYFNGKTFDPIFWAPKDYTIDERIFQWYGDPGQWPGPQAPHPSANNPYWFASTYCHSVAAMVNSEVYDKPVSAGGLGPKRAVQIASGHKSPSLGQARYPDLKTHVLEHYWLQQNPSEYIPGSDVPWFFNMGADSTPATLFYDGHVRMMSVREAVQSSQRNIAQSGYALDSTDVGCFGTGGYFENYVYGGNGNAINSYHVFTTEGILGRDTFGQQ